MNKDIKSYADKKGVLMYEIAGALNTSVSNLYNSYLHSNSKDKHDKLIRAIDNVSKSKEKAGV
ncbi:hypothetical protein [Apilactobacillus xinyiensis]|uniref:hypothetical protein n=1 Tax=Apilactobacillus xinyiensis TaxID=2841032 RepID=UPI0020106393|nr:hypothetical protein [Apilactobacillus xinyiensis]MCL0330846.1 hypothetical protein [Apilactobacillus xinyiensis]